MVFLSQDGHMVGDLAKIIDRPAAKIITHFFMKGLALKVNDMMDIEQCEEIAQELDVEYIVDSDEKESEAANRGFLSEEKSDDSAKPRPPVVTVMGHVDHGKTTLLDTIRQRSVAASEAGGITQRIGAYTVEVGDSKEKVTFIDTPGHEAFTAMRARGAQVTDITILVVAATDGVMPQTREAISHVRAAEVPMIVAINKIDMPNADAEQTRIALSEEGIVSEEWGGEVPFVEVSAKKNINIDSLLEVVYLTAEVGELKAPYDCPAAGVVLESTFNGQSGTLATLLVQRGTLKAGDVAVSGSKVLRVRAMMNEAGTALKECPPSTAVQVIGFNHPPEAGDQFEVMPSIAEARSVADKRLKEAKTGNMGFLGQSTSSSDQLVRLAIILKTDAQGSIAAVKHLFNSVKDSKYVNLRWVLEAPGPITQSDVELASSCPEDQRVMVVGFNTSLGRGAEAAAKKLKVEIRNFTIIYELFETIVAALESDLKPEEQLKERGAAQVLAVFGGKFGNVAGVRVTSGQLKKGNRVKVYRGDGGSVGEGPIISLRRGPEDVDAVDQDTECGFSLEGWDSWKKGDMIRCFSVDMVKPTIAKKR